MSIEIRGTTRLAGVMGWPVKHSRSPRLHSYWLAEHGIDGAYVPLPVAPADLRTALRALPALGFAGTNLTVPHKESALAVIDGIDEVARRIGAVNTVVVRSDGTLEGRNTDAYGFMAHLRQEVPDWQANTPAVVIGAGGAARAVVVGLIDAGVPEIRIVNRTQARADELQSLGSAVKVHRWVERAAVLEDVGLVVNATTLGMTGCEPLDLSLRRLPERAVIYDIVYSPLETGLLAAGRAAGHAVVDGLGMLLHQARPAFQAFFGTDPAVTAALRDHVLADMKRP
jgi:shikimate dehydrogenase